MATGGVMLDLGANVGRMAVPRLILGDVTAAYCAEPDPVNFLPRAQRDRQRDALRYIDPDEGTDVLLFSADTAVA